MRGVVAFRITGAVLIRATMAALSRTEESRQQTNHRSCKFLVVLDPL